MYNAAVEKIVIFQSREAKLPPGEARRELRRILLGALRTGDIRRRIRIASAMNAAGLVLGILASRVLASIVYQATPRDPLVLAGVVSVMFVLGLLATWIPAQRALSIDPLRLLREE